MPERRASACAFVLLLVTLVAGVGFPLAHQVHHGLEHARLAEAIARQHDHVHAASSSFSSALDGLAHGDALCSTCGTIGAAIAVVRIQVPAATLLAALGTWIHGREDAHPSLGLFIRGPPGLR